MTTLRRTVVVVLALVIVVAVVLAGVWIVKSRQVNQQQEVLQPFYTPPSPLPSVPPGTLLRSEVVEGVEVPNAVVRRVLYTTELADGTPAVSGGLVFVPTVPPPNADGTRPVIAWAHPTTGQGDACAPSRGNPLLDTAGWLVQMMSLGWLVAATDYAGLGTPGPDNYLVARSEVSDLVNSVRSASTLPDAHAGRKWVVWGHSQGGHSVLWAGHLAAELAPDWELLAVAAAAPAAQLAEIMQAQWPTPVGWVIGPEATQSWADIYPELEQSLPSSLSSQALDSYASLADDCIQESGVKGLAHEVVGQTFFASDPTQVPSWMAAVTDQTPAPLPASMPVFIAQGTADEVVLPQPQALLQEEWCAAGSDLTMLWMGGVTHQDAAKTSGPNVVPWIADRFAGAPTNRTCTTPPPVTPSAVVAAGTDG